LKALRPIRSAIDWGDLAPLRLRARLVAEGVYAGLHRSARRGAGVEFGGFREYVPGDDLRWLDRRSLLRHDRLVVRQFETETDRALCLLVDASASMGFRSAGPPRAPGAKVAFAAVVAAALARLALAGGDPVSLAFLGGERGGGVARSGGREQFERIVAALEAVEPGGDARADPAMVERALQAVARAARRGAIIVLLSDLIDLPPGAAERVGALAAGGRLLSVVQTLDPAEISFPFQGTVRLRALEGTSVIETDAEVARPRYLAALAAQTDAWRAAVVRHDGRFLTASSAQDPVAVVRGIVQDLRFPA
jgi:uncharacterized protein (DUF58 family)